MELQSDAGNICRPYPYLTADDWGISREVNAGILDLAERGCICRVSAMPNEGYFEHDLSRLLNIRGLKLGLHFNLTHGFSLRSPEALMRKWIFSGRATKRALIAWSRETLLSQLEGFSKRGLSPDYFDSHHHIHLIPGLFENIADILLSRGISEIRVPADSRLLLTAKFPVHLLAVRLRTIVSKYPFAVRDFFYPTPSDFRNPKTLKSLLDQNDQKEILVHPGLFEEGQIPECRFDRQRKSEYDILKKVISCRD